MADELFRGLNHEQQLAVTLPDESALILAGAGSGKTRVLTTRIAWLIANQRVGPLGVLAVTFTNKAAKEMVARIGTMLPINLRGMWIGTFHGLCHRMLRAHHHEAQLPATFTIMDSQDQLAFIKRLFKTHQIAEERFQPRAVMGYINAAKDEGLRSNQVESYDANSQKLNEIYRLYEQQCEREGVVDFAELLLRSYELLAKVPMIRQHYQRRFRHILVDEFQDTNRLQYDWLKLLSGVGEVDVPACVFAVGDDDQSIYAFRGAKVANMLAFEQEFGVKTRIKLEENYRSTFPILEAANQLIANNSRRLGKNLRTQRPDGEKIRVYEALSDVYEANWVTEMVERLHQETRIPYHEMAVLYRSNAQSRSLEHAFFVNHIPYRVYGGLRFFERAEIKHAMAYLQLIANPHHDPAALRVINFPARGIGARSVEQWQLAAFEAQTSLCGAIPFMTGKAQASIQRFFSQIDGLRSDYQTLPLPELIQRLLHDTGLLAHYQTEKEGADRIENLNELVNAATNFYREEGLNFEHGAFKPYRSAEVGSEMDSAADLIANPITQFLANASLESGEVQATQSADAVQLMTVHASKGLEFEAVFITGLEESLFPHENSQNERDGLEEERRLMYVAMTRAKRHLHISFAQTRLLHGQTRYHMRSRFLEELPPEHLHWSSSPPRHRLSQNSWEGKDWQSDSVSDWSVNSIQRGNQYKNVSSNPKQAQTGSLTQNYSNGMAVFHNKFGEGIIAQLIGHGDEQKAKVLFKRHGEKTLLLKMANLQVI